MSDMQAPRFFTSTNGARRACIWDDTESVHIFHWTGAAEETVSAEVERGAIAALNDLDAVLLDEQGIPLIPGLVVEPTDFGSMREEVYQLTRPEWGADYTEWARECIVYLNEIEYFMRTGSKICNI